MQTDDGLTDSYEDFIESVQALHDELEELREWVAVHDALLQESTGQIYSSVEGLFKAMGLKK
jgi:cell division septum initiation protein DivIVA